MSIIEKHSSESVVEAELRSPVETRARGGLPSVIERYVDGELEIVLVSSAASVVENISGAPVEVRKVKVEGGSSFPSGIEPTIIPGVGPVRLDLALGIRFRVQSSSPLYLESGGVNTLSAPLLAPVNFLTGALSLSVDRPDASRTYALELLVDGSVHASISLGIFETETEGLFLGVISQGSELRLRVRLDTGTGLSTFRNIRAILTLQEL